MCCMIPNIIVVQPKKMQWKNFPQKASFLDKGCTHAVCTWRLWHCTNRYSCEGGAASSIQQTLIGIWKRISSTLKKAWAGNLIICCILCMHVDAIKKQKYQYCKNMGSFPKLEGNEAVVIPSWIRGRETVRSVQRFGLLIWKEALASELYAHHLQRGDVHSLQDSVSFCWDVFLTVPYRVLSAAEDVVSVLFTCWPEGLCTDSVINCPQI